MRHATTKSSLFIMFRPSDNNKRMISSGAENCLRVGLTEIFQTTVEIKWFYGTVIVISMFYATCVEIATADLNSSFGPTKRAIKFYCCRSAYANIVSECKRVDQEGEGGGNVCRVEYLLESISKGLGVGAEKNSGQGVWNILFINAWILEQLM